MNELRCAAASFLRSPGPVQVPFRPCCAAAVLLAAQAPALTSPHCPQGPEPPGAAPDDALLLHREAVP